MSYLLDTCTLSDYLKGDINTIQRLKQEKPYNIFVSSITRFETLSPSPRPRVE